MTPTFDGPYSVLAIDEALRAVLALHKVETRWLPWSDATGSYVSYEEALDEESDEEPTSFEICAECGRIEMAEEQHGLHDCPAYLNGLYPCATVRAITEALDGAEPFEPPQDQP